MALPVITALPQNGSIVSRWKLTEASGSRADSVGSNTLTDNNTVTGGANQFGEATSDFERGNSEYLSIADGSQSGLDFSTAFTFAWWVKIESAAFMGHFGKYTTTGSQRAYSFQHSTSTQALDIALSSNGGTPWNKGDTVTIGVGEWHHIVWTYKGGNTRSKVYVDGIAKASWTDAPASLHNSTEQFEIGMAADDLSFDGLMQDVVAWNVELTDAEVKSLYGAYFNLPAIASLPQTGSVLSRWPLTEDGGTRHDHVSTNHLTDNNTVLSGAGISEVNASAERSADFEQSNSEYLSITDGSQTGLDPGTNSISYFCWVKLESQPGHSKSYYLGAKWKSGSRGWMFRISEQSDDVDFRIGVYFNDDSGGGDDGNYYNSDDVFTLTLGQWYHIGFTFDAAGTTLKFYKDGVQFSNAETTANNGLKNSTADFRIGGSEFSGAGDYMDGLMQDSIFWSGAALSAAEVLALYELYTALPGGGLVGIERRPMRGVGRGIMRP